MSKRGIEFETCPRWGASIQKAPFLGAFCMLISVAVREAVGDKLSMWYVYIIEKRNKYYTGITTNNTHRLRQHSVSGEVYKEAFETKIDAAAREKQIKRWSRSKKKLLIENKLHNIVEWFAICLAGEFTSSPSTTLRINSGERSPARGAFQPRAGSCHYSKKLSLSLPSHCEPSGSEVQQSHIKYWLQIHPEIC